MCLYLFPTELEAKPFRTLCPDAEVVISGVGMVATAATLLRLMGEGVIRSNNRVILAGVAGTYGDVEVGRVVEVVEERCSELPERFQRSYRVEPSTSLRRVVSNTVHGKYSPILGASIENMEGAALFAIAEVMGFRAVEIRAISNCVGENFDMWRLDEALEALANELKKIEYAE